MTPEACDNTRAALRLDPLHWNLDLPPRLTRWLRIIAAKQGRAPEAVAARLLARALVPDHFERRRLVRADLRDAGVEQ